MTALVLIGDLLVMGFLCAVVAWLLWLAPREEIEEARLLPLIEDEVVTPPNAEESNSQ